MKLSAQDEYGLRILLRIARHPGEEGLPIPVLAELEGISQPYAAKILRSLRLGGFLQSTKGKNGGYQLAKPAEQIKVGNVLKALGGKLFDEEYCKGVTGTTRICTNSVDCSVRSLWSVIQRAVDQLLDQISLADMLDSEIRTSATLENIAENLGLIQSS